MELKYCEEERKKLTPLLVVEEATRCLLCEDAPCSLACPAQTNPGKFIRSIRFRNFKGAAETVRSNNALAGICARVCPVEKLCEMACTRCGIDKPINIAGIQQYITDYEDEIGMVNLVKSQHKHQAIAIVGSGPSGLQAAATLRTLGYEVSIYEKNSQFGGWLRAIPEYRLPNSIVDKEIERIKKLGVSMKANMELGKNLTIEELKKDYQAILLAIGNSHGKMLAMFKDSPYTLTAAEFLKIIKEIPDKIIPPNTALVIGGGDVAMDIATSLKKLGAQNVTCVARETLNIFPATKESLTNTFRNEVSIIDGYSPISFNKQTVCFKHEKIDSELKLTADLIILAIGQYPDFTGIDVEVEKGLIKTEKFRTNDPKIFATGDIIAGEKTVVYAVKLGKEAAYQIDEELGGKNNA